MFRLCVVDMLVVDSNIFGFVTRISMFAGKLKCKKHIDDTYRNEAGKPSAQVSADGHYTDDYMVIDPRSQRSR